jgi:lycopene beta-cyclase
MRTNLPDECSDEYDLVIIGGGCSGLSLATAICNLATTPEHAPHTLIIEPRSHYTDDRSWCFWGRKGGMDGKLIGKSWPAWEFSSDSVRHQHRSETDWGYHYVPSIRFYDHAEKVITLHPRMTLLTDSCARDISPAVSGIEVGVEKGISRINPKIQKITARQVVDTRIPDEVDFSSAALKQVFFGFEVKTNKAHQFDDVALVMKDMRVDRKGFLFDYVLPLGRDSFLIELTRFAPEYMPPESLRDGALELVRRVCGDNNYKIIRQESGVIPMGMRDFVKSADPRWIQTGIGVGSARPSTGYAFKRIQQWAEQCAKGILLEGQARPFPPDSALLTWMDNIFLRAIRENPSLAPTLFMSLARGVHPDCLLRFLTDIPSKRDLFAIMRSLPKLPLIQSALREIGAGIQSMKRGQAW